MSDHLERQLHSAIGIAANRRFRDVFERSPNANSCLYLARMALFDLQTGARDAVVCGLRWEWEIPVPELGLSVFEVPRQAVKGRQRVRILVCNSVAQSIIESVRGQHPEFVFVYGERRKKSKPGPMDTMNKIRDALELITDERNCFNKSLASLIREKSPQGRNENGLGPDHLTR